MGGYGGSVSQTFIIGVILKRLEQRDILYSARILRLANVLLLLGELWKYFPSVRSRGF